MADFKDLKVLTDKKLRTVRNNLNNRLESFKKGAEKALPPSHMLHGLDEGQCSTLLGRIYSEMKKRSK